MNARYEVYSKSSKVRPLESQRCPAAFSQFFKVGICFAFCCTYCPSFHPVRPGARRPAPSFGKGVNPRHSARNVSLHGRRQVHGVGETLPESSYDVQLFHSEPGMCMTCVTRVTCAYGTAYLRSTMWHVGNSDLPWVLRILPRRC